MLSPAALQEALGEGGTLRVVHAGETLFASQKRWIHPLFDLQAYQLLHPDLPWKDALLMDRVTGRAAAFLVAELGFRRMWTGLLSRRAVPVLEAHGITYEAVGYVDRIACSTEETFAGINDLAVAAAALERLKQRNAQP